MEIIPSENLTYGFAEAFTFVLHAGGPCVDNLERTRQGEVCMGISRAIHPGWPGWFIFDRERAEGRDPATEPASETARALRGLARSFYREHFWEGVYADTMPSPLSLALFDSAVVHGRNQALRFLQHALNTILGRTVIEVDGIFRTDSRRALDAVIGRGDAWYLRLLVSEFLRIRQTHCDGIGCGNRGVTARCAARVGALARIAGETFGHGPLAVVPAADPDARRPLPPDTSC